MGGAQPLAAVMAGAHCIAIEVQESRIEKRLETRYLDRRATSIDEALEIIRTATEPTSVGLLGNAAEILPEMLARGIRPDALTDQTSAHDPANGYCPAGWSVAKWQEMRERDPAAVAEAARSLHRPPCRGDAVLSRTWAFRPSITATTSARKPRTTGVTHAFDFPGFVPAYVRPLFCRGIGPFRWAALSGDPEDIYRTDQRVKELIPDDPHLHRWLDMARERIAFQGLPARICWVGLGQRHRLGLAFNEMVRNGEVSAPIVIGRDHLDSGSVASPNRETESMKDGSDAISDWPLLNALLNTACGATWVSLHHGGGVGMGYSQHAGMVIVADGTDDAARRLERVLWNDPGTGVMRHADAGYEIAIDCAREQGLDLPMGECDEAQSRGHIDLDMLRQLWSGAEARLDDASMQRVAELRRRGRAHRRRRRDRLRRQHRLRPARQHPHPRRAARRAPDQPDPVAQRRVSAIRCRATSTRLMIVLKLLGLGRGHSGVRPLVIDALQRLLDADAMPLDPVAGQRRRIGRPRAAGAPDLRADGLRPHLLCRRGRRLLPPRSNGSACSRCSSARRKGSR